MRELVKSLPDPSSSAISGVTKLMTNTYVSFLFTQIAQGIQSSRKLMTDAYASFPFTQIARGIQWSRLTNLLVFSGREARLEMARKLMDTYKPKIIRLKRGSIKLKKPQVEKSSYMRLHLEARGSVAIKI
jgi:hypothetical protein